MRIRLFSDATVRHLHCCLHLPPLDLSGAASSYDRRHRLLHRVLKTRVISSRFRLSPFPIFNAARRFTACPLLTAIPVPLLVALASAHSRPDRSGPSDARRSALDQLSRSASERRRRLAHRSVCSYNPPLGKRDELPVEPRNIVRIPTFRNWSNQTFPQSFETFFVEKPK